MSVRTNLLSLTFSLPVFFVDVEAVKEPVAAKSHDKVKQNSEENVRKICE
jgi:hypothetical protein